ncbi:hypothetical protein ACX0FE_15935, partial [Enterococcus faecium]
AGEVGGVWDMRNGRRGELSGEKKKGIGGARVLTTDLDLFGLEEKKKGVGRKKKGEKGVWGVFGERFGTK